MLCNLEFFSLRSSISSSCLSIFFSRDLTLIFKASLFSVSILTLSLFSFNSVSTSFKEVVFKLLTISLTSLELLSSSSDFLFAISNRSFYSGKLKPSRA